MAQGKQTCKILKEIRKQIADANDIEFVTSECRYKGDCLGSCPKCEAEVQYLEQQLRSRQLMGKTIVLAGISAGALAMLTPAAVQSQTPDESCPMRDVVTHPMAADTIIVKGMTYCEYNAFNGTFACDTLTGASIRNVNLHKHTVSDIDGKFEIEACIGDSIEVSYIGFNNCTVVVKDNAPLTITLNDKGILFLGEVISLPYRQNGNIPTIDLIIMDEKGNRFTSEKVSIKRVMPDSIIEGNWPDLYPTTVYNKDFDRPSIRLYWDEQPDLYDGNGNLLKEVELYIKVDGYDSPKTVKVKRRKRSSKKTIKFK